MTPRLLAPILLAATITPAAIAQHITTEYAIDFVTVGDPGNRAPVQDEVPQRPWLSFGSVDQTFRIARTTTTATQWLEFIGAYAPLNENPTDINFTSNLISPDYTGNYYIRSPEIVNFPVEVSFLYAARYCNWLHNGMVNEAWAFESGAYDMSTFFLHPETGDLVGDPTRSPNARYWIPTADEWIKAFYYDENRYANGDGGYWLYPHGSNEPPITGYPEDGGETNAGEEPYVTPLLPVGSYPNAASPWGALDASGQVREWTASPYSEITGEPDEYLRLLQVGSSAGFPYPWLYDRLDYQAILAPAGGFGRGFRIATTIPAPASAVPMLVAWCALRRRDRHEPPVHRMCNSPVHINRPAVPRCD